MLKVKSLYKNKLSQNQSNSFNPVVVVIDEVNGQAVVIIDVIKKQSKY